MISGRLALISPSACTGTPHKIVTLLFSITIYLLLEKCSVGILSSVYNWMLCCILVITIIIITITKADNLQIKKENHDYHWCIDQASQSFIIYIITNLHISNMIVRVVQDLVIMHPLEKSFEVEPYVGDNYSPIKKNKREFEIELIETIIKKYYMRKFASQDEEFATRIAQDFEAPRPTISPSPRSCSHLVWWFPLHCLAFSMPNTFYLMTGCKTGSGIGRADRHHT